MLPIATSQIAVPRVLTMKDEEMALSSAETVEAAIDELWDQKSARSDERLATLCDIFRDVDGSLSSLPENGTDARTGDLVDRLIAAQSNILNTAAVLPANSVDGVLLKLALWRWESGLTPQSLDDLPGPEAVVYSAFLDLLRLIQRPDLAQPCDKDLL